MSTRGQEISNPAMGARIVFRTVAAESSGKLLEVDFFLRPGGVIATDHLHPCQEERFAVLSGAVVGHVAGVPRTLGPGGQNVVPSGVPHAWRNASDAEETHLRVQFRPALRTEEFFDVVFAMGRAGRADGAGVPRLPERLALLAAFPEEFRPAGMPTALHAALARVLGPWGRRRVRRWTADAAGAADPSTAGPLTDTSTN